jgi:hypothetical protein
MGLAPSEVALDPGRYLSGPNYVEFLHGSNPAAAFTFAGVGMGYAGVSDAPGAGAGRDGGQLRNVRARDFRSRLADSVGPPPSGALYEAHHIFPVEYGDNFARVGVDVNEGRFGTWLERDYHRAITPEYRKDWAAFFASQNPSSDEILDFGRMLGGKYDFGVHY